jgi:hypothetical protein
MLKNKKYFEKQNKYLLNVCIKVHYPPDDY